MVNDSELDNTVTPYFRIWIWLSSHGYEWKDPEPQVTTGLPTVEALQEE